MKKLIKAIIEFIIANISLNKLIKTIVGFIIAWSSINLLEIMKHDTGTLGGDPPKSVVKKIDAIDYSYFEVQLNMIIPFFKKNYYIFDEESLLKIGQKIIFKTQVLKCTNSPDINEVLFIRDSRMKLASNIVTCEGWKIDSFNASNTVPIEVTLSDHDGGTIQKTINYYHIKITKRLESKYIYLRNKDILNHSGNIFWAKRPFLNSIFQWDRELLWCDTQEYHHAPYQTDHDSIFSSLCPF